MLISLDNLGKTFFDVENIYLQLKMIKNNHYIKNHIQELNDKKKCKY